METKLRILGLQRQERQERRNLRTAKPPGLILFPDTNVLFTDPLFASERASALLDELKLGEIEVRLSPVVLAELRRHCSDRAASTREQGKKLVEAVRRHPSGPDTAEIVAALEDAQKQLDDESELVLAPLLDHPATELLDWPRANSEDLVRRELDRRRPTIETQRGSIGLRDTLIWQNLLEVVDEFPEASVLLITQDHGFFDEARPVLHSDLIEELEEHEAVERVTVVEGLPAALLETLKFKDVVTVRTAHITETLISYAQQLCELQWGWAYNARDGLTQGETAPATLPSYLEDSSLTFVEFLKVVDIGDGIPARCFFEAHLEFDASMSSSEYFAGEYPDVEWWDGEIEDSLIAVHTEREALIEVSVSYDPERGSVDDVEFISAQFI